MTGAKSFDRVVGQLGEMRPDRQLALVAHQQQVAVGRRLGDRLRGDHAGAAGAVLDHQRGLPASASFCADDARQDVADAAGLRRHQDADRPRRIVLRCARARARATRQRAPRPVIERDELASPRSARHGRYSILMPALRITSP